MPSATLSFRIIGPFERLIVFPQADSAVTLAAGLHLAFELAGEWLDSKKRAAVATLPPQP